MGIENILALAALRQQQQRERDEWDSRFAADAGLSPEDAEVIAELAAMATVPYQKARKEVAKKLGIAVGMLDKLVEQYRRGSTGNGATSSTEIVIELNKTYALVLVGDKAVILKEGVAAGDFSVLTVSAFNQWYSNRFVEVGEKRKPLGGYWLGHADRRQYEGLVFAPKREVRGYYNLWRGFAVEPRPGDCSKFLAHIRDNVVSGDEDHYRWFLGWCADIFQRPDEKKGTSVALRGKEGVGKSKVFEIIGSLLGSHYVVVSDPRYVTGRFNSHMVSCLLLHAEEAFWAGDHAAEGKLKDLISGHSHLIEYKGKEPISVRNHLRLAVTGNPDWVVPVSLEGRRFAVWEVGDAQMQNKPYFAAIDEEMGRGGREALLHFLLTFDLSGVDLRTVPKTAALVDQKLASLTPEQGWLMDLLQNGRLPWGCESDDECPAEHLFADYIRHASKSGVRRRSIETKIGMFLTKMLPGLRKHQEREYRGYRGKDETGSVYEFPDLAVCRQAFAERMGQAFDWHGPDAWLGRPEDVPSDEGEEVPF